MSVGGQQLEASLVLSDSPAQYHVVLAALRSVLFLSPAEAAHAADEAHADGASVVLAGSAAACEAAASELRSYGLRVDVRLRPPGTSALHGWGSVLVRDDDSTSADAALGGLRALGLNNAEAEAAIDEIEAQGASFVFRGTLAACERAREQLVAAGLSADVRLDLAAQRLAEQLSVDAL